VSDDTLTPQRGPIHGLIVQQQYIAVVVRERHSLPLGSPGLVGLSCRLHPSFSGWGRLSCPHEPAVLIALIICLLSILTCANMPHMLVVFLQCSRQLYRPLGWHTQLKATRCSTAHLTV
jgi:hypothetical protein